MNISKRKQGLASSGRNLPSMFSAPEMTEWFDDLFRPFWGASMGGPMAGEGAMATFQPLIDIVEKKDEILLRAELPGVKADDVEVTVNNDMLTIRGHKQEKTQEEDENYRRIERRFGQFERTFRLPTMVNAEKIQAAYKDGVLELHVPIDEKARPKKISIQSS